MGDLQEWWRGVPPITKFLFGSSAGLTLGAHFGFVNGMRMILFWPPVIQNFEVWRVVSCFLFQGKLSFQFLINMMFLYRYSNALETTVFDGVTADYVFFLLICTICLLISSAFVNLYLLGNGLLLAIIYLWSRKNPNVNMTFMFGLRFKSIYLPWVLCGFNLLMGGMPIAQLLGIASGHLYFFLADLYPLHRGRRFLYTPQFLYSIWPPARGFTAPPTGQGSAGNFATNAPPERGYQWGRGQTLGQQ